MHNITVQKEMGFQAIFFLCTALLHIIILATATSATTDNFGGGERDRIALLAFKSNIKYDPQGVMSSWNNSLHFCEWQGITCGRKHRRVTVLNLNSNGLVGTLSPYIGNLSFLREMRLRNNTLQGKIPPEIGSLFRLEVLRLDINNLVGQIPKELGSLSKLKVLAISRNTLTGAIPPSMGNLTSLEKLYGVLNKFGGSIPDVFDRLTNLTELSFSANELSGTVPPSLYNCSLLTLLSLGVNQLHGNLPPNFGLLFPHLRILSIFQNNFTGPIPSSLSNATELEAVELISNKFSGKVSIDFTGLKHLSEMTLTDNNLGTGEADDLKFLTSLLNCSNLELLGLAENQFRGAWPNIIGNLSTQMITLEIDMNQISGPIPSWICTLTNLTFLGISDNQFIGPIPDAFGKLQQINQMHLHNNMLSGEIPSSLGNLSSLTELFLDGNRFQGTIPSSLGNCQNLLSIYLSRNNFSGIIPKEIFGIPTLVTLHLARNHLVGFLPSEVGALKNLKGLTLFENDLSGQIPNSLGGCSILEYLYMEGNFFHGSIPLSFSSLRGIQQLDLSQNNLSGEIPDFLEELTLTYLNLSFNDFEGEIPSKGVFTNSTALSILGNKRLCGGISELKLPNCSTIEAKKKQNKSSLTVILIAIACFLLGVTFLSSFIYFRSKRKRNDQPSGSLLKESIVKISYAMLLKATDGFSMANLIGMGSFGSVYKGLLDQDEQILAIKVLNLQRRGASKSFLAECEALRNIRHRNLLKIITSCSSVDFQGNDFKALVYEFMPNGSFEKWLHPIPESSTNQDQLQNLNLLQRINIAIDVACALDYLHLHCQPPIVHCDLKPSNILLDSDMTAHVGDFGLAKFLQEFQSPNQSSSIGIRGTIGYAAPEYGLGSEPSTSGDVYSFGIILLEMMTGKRPTDGVFKEGHNLHNFARMALPDQVMEIVDPILLNDEREAMTNNIKNPRQERNGNTRETSLISLVKIGVACSTESPQDRMDIASVARELHHARDILQPAASRHQRQRGP